MMKVSGSVFMNWKENEMGKEIISSSALKFRWINAQCIEIKLNNGKTLLIDPWFTNLEEKGAAGRVVPLERCRWYSLNLSITECG